uniref:Large ribosomal subunit protein bL20c n=2 Tax=unclassified Chloroparvula TaxID=2565278 RepID=A0A4D6C430_9CHLO|nr:ribosomal protein L20 [Chloroparvula sp. RCC696]QBX98345.1 ribosomal protein L20 [Chloroparvula sp. RCC4572]
MTRVKRGSVARKRRTKVLDQMSGARGAHSLLFRVATQQYTKSLRYAYVDRRTKKRVMRQQWVRRLNAIAHLYGFTYSDFIYRSRNRGLQMNRKVLSQLAVTHQKDLACVFQQLEN